MTGVTELPPLEDLPAPRPAPRRPVRSRSRIWLSVTTGIAGAVGFAGMAMVSDARDDDGEQATITNGANPVGLVAPASAVDDDGRQSGIGGEYASPTWSSATRTGILGSWGAVTTAVGSADGQPVVAPIGEEGIPATDPRLVDPATPAFTDPCAVRSRADEVTCPDVDQLAHVVLGGDHPPPNTASLHPFPTGDELADATADADSDSGAAPCDFADADLDQLPILVVTANPGEVTVSIGGEEQRVESTELEREEWDTWMERPLGTRPAASFVGHCVLLDRPTATGPVTVRATAVDDEDQVATADATVGGLVERLPPVVVTPVDPTMVRVDVPLPPGDDLASVTAIPTRSLGGVADCQRLTPDVAAGAGAGWRRGAAAMLEPSSDPARPWLEAAPRLQRVTVPLAEGEPNLLCVSVGTGPRVRRLALVAVPPDARRLTLAATELRLVGAPPGGAVELTATFPELGWVACGARMPASGAGSSLPGTAGVLCESGGDTGAITAAGGLVELAIRAGEGSVHTVRLALVPTPGGPASEAYRLPIPLPTFDGLLCTPGADQPSCVEPDPTTSVGTVILAARWSEGPVGESTAWSITAP